MTSIEFENSVAEEYRAKGYDVRLTSRSYVYGVKMPLLRQRFLFSYAKASGRRD